MSTRKVNVCLMDEDLDAVSDLRILMASQMRGRIPTIKDAARYALHYTAHRLGKVSAPPKMTTN